MLSGTALAISDSLSQFPDDFLASGDGRFDESQIYLHPLERAPLIDGYFDDWPLDSRSHRTLRGSDGDARFVLGQFRQHIYLYVDVQDDSPVFLTQSQVDSDKVVIVSAEPGDDQRRIVFAAEAPGSIQAVVQDASTVADSRISAHWLDTTGGYRLEARIPRSLLASHAGIEIVNARPGTAVTSRSFERQSPGRLISSSPLLESVARGYVQSGLRLTITDRSGWRLAVAGNLDDSDSSGSNLPRGWQLVLYRALLEEGESAALAEPDASGREQQNYVARALNSESSTSWFRNEATGRAVVAVAQPVWSGTVQTGAIILQQDTDAILSLTNSSLMRLITLTVVATLGAAAALLGYASWLSLRIRRLSHAAEHALDSARPSTDLPSGTAADEVGDLSRSFSSVLGQLGDYNEYLRSLASKLSHELRTPLTIVTSSLENLEHEPLNEQSREYTGRARDGALRLQKILSAMSEANRVEQLMENVETELFPLTAVVRATAAAYAGAWPERTFDVEGADSDDLRVSGSPELIIQMLDKLADNAVDFSQPNDTITIRLQEDEERISVSVSNPGPPLPESMRHRLFESMISVRPDASGDNLGLGLNIAKIIAEGHGGTIGGSNIEGGVMFVVSLPLKRIGERNEG